MNSLESRPLKQYCNIVHGHYRELLVLRELHEQNWKDFLELKRVGHSELELSRMKPKQKRAIGLLLGITGLFSGFSPFSTYKLKAEVQSLRSNHPLRASVDYSRHHGRANVDYSRHHGRANIDYSRRPLYRISIGIEIRSAPQGTGISQRSTP